ncbi:MAG: DinB family protein [Anaerolineales bacterium]
MKPSQTFQHWEQVRADLHRTIDMFSEQELTFSPFTGSWPVGQIMLHIADCEDNWLFGVVQHQIKPWIFYDLADYPNQTAIKGALDRAHLRTIAFLNSLDESDLDKQFRTPDGHAYNLGWIIWHVLEHEIHHRGELSLALGILGREGLDV